MIFSSSEEINEESVGLNNWKVKISIILEVTLQKKRKKNKNPHYPSCRNEADPDDRLN